MGLRRREGWIVAAIALAFALVSLPRELRLEGPRLPALPVASAELAPPFELPLAGGGSAALGDYAGSVVLLNFWATWCKPCEDEMPAMQRLYTALGGGDGFELLAVSVDAGDEEVEAFRERLAIGFPILRDPDRRVATRYQSLRFPESFLIGPDGVVAARFIGPREWDAPEYEARIRELLAAAASGG